MCRGTYFVPAGLSGQDGLEPVQLIGNRITCDTRKKSDIHLFSTHEHFI